MSKRTKLFISYSHKDSRWLNLIREQLRVLEREDRLDVFDDTKLRPGENWRDRLNVEMSTARVGMLLVSAPFLSSPFIREEEVPRLFSRHSGNGMLIYPLLVRDCPWQLVDWLAQSQIRPLDSTRQPKPIAAYRGAARDQVLADVAREIDVVVNPTSPIAKCIRLPKPDLIFDQIRIAPGLRGTTDLAWSEGQKRVFQRTYELAMDPVLDVVVANTSNRTILIRRIGIQIQDRKPGTGGTMGYPTQIQSQCALAVDCPEAWKRFDLTERECSTELHDPITLKRSDHPFRFSLQLKNFCDPESASSSEIRLYVENDNERFESSSIFFIQ